MGTGFSPFPDKCLGLEDLRWRTEIQAEVCPGDSEIGALSPKQSDEKNKPSA